MPTSLLNRLRDLRRRAVSLGLTPRLDRGNRSPASTGSPADARRVAATQRISFGGATMATQYSVTLYAGSQANAAELQQAVDAAITQVDAHMSTWKPLSPLSRLNAMPPGEWLDIPADLGDVLALGLDIGTMTKGAFDMSVGRLVNAWGFGPSPRRDAATEPAAVRAATSAGLGNRVDVRADHCAARRLTDCQIDLCAIAKGYAVDQAGWQLEAAGVTNYVVVIDGEVRCRGTKPGGQPWNIAIEQPAVGVRQIQRVLALRDWSAATSGTYRNYVDFGAVRVSHTMDGRSGAPVANRVVSVTVLDRACAVADALATALLVMGETDGPAFANRHGIPAYFLFDESGATTERSTANFDDIVAGARRFTQADENVAQWP